MGPEKCVRYSYAYQSTSEEVRDYILRSADCAEKTYGRDPEFARFHQVLDFARFLGWHVPRCSKAEMPDFLQELSPDAVNVIFEIQAKLLVDVSPVAEIQLEDGSACPVRMVCSTTPAGDLVWRCHLLVDSRGSPYVSNDHRERSAKTRGTQVICSPEFIPYNEEVLISYFDSDGKGVWPVPFLPEFFSHHPLAAAFSLEEGMIELCKIQERHPLRVISSIEVPSFYRTIQIDRTRLPIEDYASNSQDRADLPKRPNRIAIGERFSQDPFDEYEALSKKNRSLEDEFSEEFPEPHIGDMEEVFDHDEDDFDEGPVEGFEEEGDPEDEDEYEENHDDYVLPDLPRYVNVVTGLAKPEVSKLQKMVTWLEQSEISSKDEAKNLQASEDIKEREKAEKWLLTAIHRLTLLANTSQKIGATLSLIQKHGEQQIVVLQPRDKWAIVLCGELDKRGFKAEVLQHTKTKSKAQIKRFDRGKTQILICSKARPELFNEGVVVVCMSSFAPQEWFEWLNTSHTVYGICIEELGLEDLNYVQEHPLIVTDVEMYTGPGLSLFKNSEIPAPKIKKPKAPKKPKYTIKTSRGRPAKADSYEKAVEVAKKKEDKGMSCEIQDPGGEVVYITNVGDVS